MGTLKIKMEDVLAVAQSLPSLKRITVAQMEEALNRYEYEQEQDPGATWNLVVEHILYSLLDEQQFNPVKASKEVLEKAGYYVDKLWTIHDLNKYEGTFEQKLKVLDRALNNEYTMEQIQFAIRDAAEAEGLIEIEEEEE
jgi:hypothetical protein